MKDKPTKILVREHRRILRVIEALKKEVDALESGGDINAAFFEKAIDFIRNYADKFHHAKEEDILFAELRKDSVRMNCDPIEQMLYEHDLGRGFVRGLKEGLGEGNKDKIIENASKYAQLLQEHICKEDDILYPMADEALSQEAQKLILAKFRRVGRRFDRQKKRHILFVEGLEKQEGK